MGELSVSAYILLRYMNQMPGSQEYTDHLGNVHTTNGREDIYSHRILLWLKGWMFDPKLIYVLTFWTVNTTDQDAIFGNIGYPFCKEFNLYAGVNGNSGSRSLNGSYPYWLVTDRVMADEFFRPFFSQGMYANGELLPGFFYSGMVGNNNSIVGANWYPFDTRDTRLNIQLMDVNHSPVSSTFGYYTAGQDGETIAVSFSLMF